MCAHGDALKCVWWWVGGGCWRFVCVWIRLICSNGELKVEVEGKLRIKQIWRMSSDCNHQFNRVFFFPKGVEKKKTRMQRHYRWVSNSVMQ